MDFSRMFQVLKEDKFECPITKLIVVDPVRTKSGFYFERQMIKSWILQRGTCPLTRQRLYLAELTEPTEEYQKEFQQFKEQTRELDLFSKLHKDIKESIRMEIITIPKS
ncbi:wd40 repeat protein [Stylonychia lemnae]|uniref:Wd40 repeat protein n=1 Tax=Stylonychia lemnae TaxID=5949 RepID=A0A078BAB3_STYLE|nr:wd40 repeat protein [Stylonychia lemnae]|eukprot:CDW90207.1 wd40 repeat protein [Stylonychia lemnae]